MAGAPLQRALVTILASLSLSSSAFAQGVVSGPSSATTNAVPSFQDNKHLKDNPLVTIVGGHLYIAGAPVLTNAPAGITFSVNGTSSSAPNLTNTSTLVIVLNGNDVSFFPTNLANAQVASGAAIDQSKISGLVAALAALQTGSQTLTNWSAVGTNEMINSASGSGTNTSLLRPSLSGATLSGLTTNSGVGATKVVVTDSAGVETGATLSGLSLVGTTLSTTENGTVTSVAMTVPSQFAVSGSPITTSGTLALTLTNSTGTGKVSLDTDPSLTRPALAGATISGSTTNSWGTASTFVTLDSAKAFSSTAASAALAATLTDETGTGLVVFGTDASLTRPALDGATWSGSTTNSSGTASRFLTLDSAKVVSTSGASADLAATLSDETGTGLAVFGTDPSLTRPALAGATLSGSTTNSAGTASRFVTLDSAKALSNTGASADLAATLSDESGTGLAIFGTDPSLTRPAIAGATISGTTTNTSIFSGTFTNTGAMGVSGNFSAAGTISTGSSVTGSGGVISGGAVRVATSSALQFGTTVSHIKSSADGLIELFNNAESGFTRLNFGGTTATFPAWTRNAAGLLLQGADGVSASTNSLTIPGTLNVTNGVTFGSTMSVAGASTLSGAVTAPSIVVTNATTTGTLTVGGGTSILKVISATATLDFPNTLAQTDSDLTITLTGAALGDVVDLGVPNGSTQAGSCFSAWVSSANTVTVRFSVYGLAAKDPASGTFRVAVTQF